jgi:hypothetical protein
MKLLFPLIALSLTLACAAPSLPSGPSSVAAGSTASVADNPPTGTAGTSCSSLPIRNFRVTGGELVSDRWKNLVEWTPVVNVTSYVLEYQKRGGSAQTRTFTGRTSVEVYDFGDGIFAGRIKPNCDGGRFTALVEWTNGYGSLNGPPDPVPAPPPAPKPTPCAWYQTTHVCEVN